MELEGGTTARLLCLPMEMVLGVGELHQWRLHRPTSTSIMYLANSGISSLCESQRWNERSGGPRYLHAYITHLQTLISSLISFNSVCYVASKKGASSGKV